MSEINTATNDLVNHLRAELAEARKQAAGYRTKYKAARSEFDSFKADHEKVVAKRDEYKKQLEQRPDPESEVEKLRSQIRERDHKDAFKALYEDKELGLNPKVPVEKLWKLIDYKAEVDSPDLEQVKATVGKLRESDPYLFAPASQAEASSPGGTQVPPPVSSPDPGFRRGNPDSTQGLFVYRNADTVNPHWMAQNQAAFHAALAAGRAKKLD